tara:strand:+ start:445 stop:675 length:231 start_codon:yes stop_codon:yes gene_type:complete
MRLLDQVVNHNRKERESIVVRVICIIGFEDDDVKLTVIDAGGVLMFMQLLYSENIETQRFACHALSALAADGLQVF